MSREASEDREGSPERKARDDRESRSERESSDHRGSSGDRKPGSEAHVGAEGKLSDDQLYDVYLDALLTGDAPDADSFLEDHAGASAELRQHLASMHRSISGRRGSEQPAAAGGLPFERLGEFRLLRELGSGGMGRVYLAEQESIGRPVALKILHEDRAHSEQAAERLRREAQAAARLRHPHLVSLYTYGVEAGVHFLAMESVEGRGVDELLAEAGGAGLPPQQVVRWGARLARALHYAHEQGVVHRDVKPSNILITEDGEPKLLDFGLARTADASISLTQGFVGSPAYMAPEQIAQGGGEIDGRSDVYSLSVTLYECLTGRVPFQGREVEATFRAILQDPVPPLRRWQAAIPLDVENVVLQAMSREARDRYASAAALADDLEAVLTLRPVQARAPTPVDRLRRWAGRHRATSAALLTILVGALALAMASTWGAARDRRQRREQAAQILTEVRAGVTAYGSMHPEEIALEEEIGRYHATRFATYTSPDQDQWLDRHEREVQRSRERRELAFLELLARLSDAARLGAEPDEVRRVRANLDYAKVEEARRLRDPVRAQLYADRVRREDPEGEFSERLAGVFEVELEGLAPDVEVHLFHFRELSRLMPGGEPRLVPLPTGRAQLPIEGAPWALRVVRGGVAFRPGDLVLELAGHPIRDAVFVQRGEAGLQRGDRLVSIDTVAMRDLQEVHRAEFEPGPHHYVFLRREERIERQAPGLQALGVELVGPVQLAQRGEIPAQVWRDGRLEQRTLPQGLELRPTAAPLYLGPDSRLGVGPVGAIPLEVGHHLVVLRPPTGLPVRRVLRVDPLHEASRSIRVQVDRPAEIPDGFVRVHGVLGQAQDYWIHEREVTLGEYLSFLNDPAVNAGIPRGTATRLLPRDPQNASQGGHLQRDQQGRYQVPSHYGLDFPVFGISWNDAKAYIDWLNARPATLERRLQYSMPDRFQWASAGLGTVRRFVFGDSFRHKWASTCFARPQASPEPVLGFPIDESVFGVYDLTGSVSEYLAGWEVEGVHRRVGGGSWGTGGPEDLFHAAAGSGMAPDGYGNTLGLRLVVRILGEDGR